MSQPAYATPWPAYATSYPRTGAWGDYFRGMAFVAWLFLLVVSFWWLSDWRDIFALRESGFDKYMQYSGFAIALIASLTLGFTALFEEGVRFSTSVKGRCLGGFCLLMLVLAPISLTPLRSAAYALATLGALLLCSCMWRMDYERLKRVLLIAALVLLGFIVLLFLHHGLNRANVGGIQRNRLGQSAFAAAVCLFIARGKLKWAGILFTILLAAVITSRGTLLACGVFVTTYLAFKYGMGRGLLAAMILPLMLMFFMAVPKIGDRFENIVVNDIAKLHDKGRGLGSGFTSRLPTWQKGLKVFTHSPAVGHGFRSRAVGVEGDQYLAHSGYVNLLADSGIIGTALVLFAFAYDFFKRFGAIRTARLSFSPRHLPPEAVDTYELNCVICAFLIAEATLWLFEPLYLNLGAALSILFLLLITAPYTVGRGAMSAAYPASMAGMGWWRPQHAGWA